MMIRTLSMERDRTHKRKRSYEIGKTKLAIKLAILNAPARKVLERCLYLHRGELHSRPYLIW